MFVGHGYHGVSKVTVRSMILQDVLYYLKTKKLKDWRCTVSSSMMVNPVIIFSETKTVVMCPFFLDNVDYSRAHYKVFDVLEAHFWCTEYIWWNDMCDDYRREQFSVY